MLDPGRRAHSLDLLALEFLGHAMISYEALCGKARAEIPFDQVPIEAARDYSCEDADITLRLRDVFAPQLEQHGLAELFRRVEVPLVCVLAEMESTGISIDESWFASLKVRFQRERERVEQEIYVEAGEEFNINSNPQLRIILFEKLRLPTRKKTSTGPSTDASVLQELADEGHVLPSLLMEYRELSKLESTYLDTLPLLLHPNDKRLHTSFNQTVPPPGAVVERSEPQNIPIRRELGRDIRRGFVPPHGMEADGGRLLADRAAIARPPVARSASSKRSSRAGTFIARPRPSSLASRSTWCRPKCARAPRRSTSRRSMARARTRSHASSRSRSPKPRVHRDLLRTLPRVRDYLDSQVAYGREHGYVETIFHRRRYVPESGAELQHSGIRRARGHQCPDPGVGGRPDQDGDDRIDAALRDRGMASGCSCRSTMSSCSKPRPMRSSR